jgi:hypothetical protein
MKTVNRNTVESNVYKRIGKLRISSGERAEAIRALQEGERIAEIILGIAHVLRLLVTMPHLKPSFKH